MQEGVDYLVLRFLSFGACVRLDKDAVFFMKSICEALVIRKIFRKIF